jgi:phosphatidylethanolamine-binding protein (PEBP) family uncharacterized protein
MPSSKLVKFAIRFYALETDLNLSPGIMKQQLARGVTGRVLAEGQLTGFYGRNQTERYMAIRSRLGY